MSLFAVATVFNMNLLNNDSDGDISLDAVAVMAQAQDESPGGYRSGPVLTNWKSYTVHCTVTTNDTRVLHLGLLGSIGYTTGKSSQAEFEGTKCGFGTGWCLKSDC